MKRRVKVFDHKLVELVLARSISSLQLCRLPPTLGVHVKVWNRWSCMLYAVSLVLSELTSRYLCDEWHLSIFTAWYRHIIHVWRAPLSAAYPLWRRFSRWLGQGEKQNTAQDFSPINDKMHAHTLADALCHTPLHLFGWTYGNVSTSQETFANVRTCGWHEPGLHLHTVQLCLGP